MQSVDLDKYPPLIPAPSNPAEWPEWERELREWRRGARMALDMRAYDRPEFAWIHSCTVCGKVMLFDREFYDEGTNSFTVGKYLERMRRDFGGLDALVLWQAYPRIGIDNRNQFDHYRLAPGLKKANAELHAAGVRVFMAYNPWDVGTRREGSGDAESIAAMVGEFGFDGVFLDTLQEGSDALRKALDQARPGVVMESERALPAAGLPIHHASWAQWLDDSEAPGVLRNQWIEPRHMIHLVRRWDLDHSGELHLAWIGGAGMLVWENIFGSWNGWNDRDKAILRAMSPVRRRYADLFAFGDRVPLVPCDLAGAYASRWESGGLKLWALVNRSWSTLSGAALPVSNDGMERLFDLVRGVELDHGHLEIGPRGIGAILSIPTSRIDDEFREFLTKQAAEYGRSAGAAPGRIEPRNSRVSLGIAGEERVVVSRFRARECGEYDSAPFPNFSYPPLHFERRVEERVRIGKGKLDDREVTNGEFHSFLAASNYRPKFSESFLAHWKDGRPVPGYEGKPVTFIDLDDARAYARWAKKRLPTEYEWQLAVAAGLQHGEVWNWTESEHFDGHTRFSILKGGCASVQAGSEWYADSGPRPADWSTKLIHFFPALDRSSTIGFRCIAPK